MYKIYRLSGIEVKKNIKKTALENTPQKKKRSSFININYFTLTLRESVYFHFRKFITFITRIAAKFHRRDKTHS